MAAYGIGDACYIIGDDNQIRRGRISSKKGDTYFVQFVGSCGALLVSEEELYRTEEDAAKSRKTESVEIINQFL